MNVAELLDPSEVTDRLLLDSLRASGGAGIKIGPEFWVPKNRDERPIQLLERVRSIYSAWHSGQVAEEASKARAAKDRNREADHGPKLIVPASAQAVQAPQAGLVETIQAQVTSLSEQLDRCEYRRGEIWSELGHIDILRDQLVKQLSIAEKFLKELKEGETTPEVPSQVGGDIHQEVGPRKSRSRRRVGAQSGAQNGIGGSESDDAKD